MGKARMEGNGGKGEGERAHRRRGACEVDFVESAVGDKFLFTVPLSRAPATSPEFKGEAGPRKLWPRNGSSALLKSSCVRRKHDSMRSAASQRSARQGKRERWRGACLGAEGRAEWACPKGKDMRPGTTSLAGADPGGLAAGRQEHAQLSPAPMPEGRCRAWSPLADPEMQPVGVCPPQ